MAHFLEWVFDLRPDLLRNGQETRRTGENFFSNQWLDLPRWTLPFKSPAFKKKKKDYSLFFFAVLPNFWKQNSKHLAARNIIVATHDSRKPVTSREWYWYQVRLWMAVQTCLAPLWCMQTHSRKLFDPGTSKAGHGKFLIIHSIFFITKIEYINTNLNNLLRMWYT